MIFGGDIAIGKKAAGPPTNYYLGGPGLEFFLLFKKRKKILRKQILFKIVKKKK